jgi:hypothetical protein
MAKRLNEHLGPHLCDWLKSMGVEVPVRFSKLKLLNSKQWDAIDRWLGSQDTLKELIKHKATTTDKVACICYLVHWSHGEKIAVSPSLIANSMNWKQVEASILAATKTK